MKKTILKNNAFTLIEVIVSITIFSIMSVSIIWVYVTISDVSLKSDINRMMQENIKSVSNSISEDVMKNWIIWVSSSSIDECDFNLDSSNYKSGDKLCTKSWNKYYLAKENPLSWELLRTDSSNCSWINDHCVIAKWINEPLTNSYVSVKELQFYLSKDAIPKVTLNLVLQPATNRWVKPNLIKETKLVFQTTISERPF